MRTFAAIWGFVTAAMGTLSFMTAGGDGLLLPATLVVVGTILLLRSATNRTGKCDLALALLSVAVMLAPFEIIKCPRWGSCTTAPRYAPGPPASGVPVPGQIPPYQS